MKQRTIGVSKRCHKPALFVRRRATQGFKRNRGSSARCGHEPLVRLGYYFLAVFPTRMKSRISRTLSYPVTAKEISEALADVPQAGYLSIEFFHYQRMKDRGKPYAVLSVHYAFTSAFERDWYVQVSAVPRNLRHTVNELLKEEAFPAMRELLVQRRNLSSEHGGQALTAVNAL
jgi:hypothetical protein